MTAPANRLAAPPAQRAERGTTERVFLVRAVLSGDFDAWGDAGEVLPGVEPTGRVDDDVPHGSGQWGERFRVVAASPTRARAKLARAIRTQHDAKLIIITDCEG